MPDFIYLTDHLERKNEMSLTSYKVDVLDQQYTAFFGKNVAENKAARFITNKT